MRDGHRWVFRHRCCSCDDGVAFTLPDLLPWRFRIVLIGQQVVLEASADGQHLSKVLEPGGSRIRCGYDLIQAPQCALIR